MNVCLHCEKAPQTRPSRLCDRCDACEGVRALYEKCPGWTPEWDAHLQKLAERAKRQLPLFPEGNELPPRPRLPKHVKPRRRRIIKVVRVLLGENR